MPVTQKITSSVGTISLTSASYANPITVTSTGTVTGGMTATPSWTVENDGSIAGTVGISLKAGGIALNQGTIAAIQDGIYLQAAGTITNAATALISGNVGVLTGATGAVTVNNSGTIRGTGGTAILFQTAQDVLLVQAGSRLIGTAAGGGGTLEFASAGGAGTVTGLGSTAAYSGFASYKVDSGANWTLAGTSTIGSGKTFTDIGSLTNLGTINGGITLGNGGQFSNAAGGTVSVASSNSSTAVTASGTAVTIINNGVIQGGNGIVIGSGTVTNAGTVTEAIIAGVELGTASVLVNSSGGLLAGGFYGAMSGGTVLNSGTISGARIAGLNLWIGGALTNSVSGLISGASGLRAGGLVDNAGTIQGTGTSGFQYGAYLYSAGDTLTNRAGALIAGNIGAVAYQTGNSIINYGTIKGAGGTAVALTSGNMLVLEAGSSLIGTVAAHGGTVALGGTGTEAGIGSGTLTGSAPGVFTSVAAYAVLAGADWTLTGATTIAAGTSLTDAGRLTNFDTIAGVGTLSVTGVLINNDTIGVTLTLSGGGQLTNRAGGTISVASGAAVLVPTLLSAGVVNAGRIAGANYGVDFLGIGTLSNASTGTISGFYGVAFNIGTLENDGTIIGTAGAGVFTDVLQIGTQNTAVTVVNDAGALIRGATYGVMGRSTVLNAGTILSSGYGLELVNSGSVSNAATGLIASYGAEDSGVNIASNLVNAGTIVGAATALGPTGVALSSATASVTNQIGGLIRGGYGVKVLGTGGGNVVVNYGTIMGAAGTAVMLGITTGKLIIEGGSTLIGKAAADGGTLELGAAGAAGTASGIGAGNFGGFGAYLVDSGANWTLTGANSIASGKTLTIGGLLTVDGGSLLDQTALGGTAPIIDVTGNGTVALLGGTPSGPATIDFTGAGQLDLANTSGVTINDFTVGDAIGVTSAAYHVGDTATYNPLLHQVTLNSDGSNFLLNAQNLTLAPGDALAVMNNGGHDQIEEEQVACFCRGTLIRTPDGEVPVEQLRVRDRVLTLSGAAQPITWIGVGHALATRGRRNAATPVLVRKGALADNVPCRDLRITKGHSLFIDNALIPVEFLVNHRSILWDDHAQAVTVFHIELAMHDVLFADGAPAESYRDDGNRWMFRNINDGWASPPPPPFAAVLTGGPIVDAVWRRLLDRAGRRPGLPLTEDADLHLLVDGVRVDGTPRAGDVRRFQLPARPQHVRIVSRAGSPAELGLARDPRTLGIAIRRIGLRGAEHELVMEACEPALRDGFHDFEPDTGWRWTNGDATLPDKLLQAAGRCCEITLHLGGLMRYPLVGDCDAVLAA